MRSRGSFNINNGYHAAARELLELVRNLFELHEPATLENKNGIHTGQFCGGKLRQALIVYVESPVGKPKCSDKRHVPIAQGIVQEHYLALGRDRRM